MKFIFITIPLVVFAYFLGFYMRLVLHLIVDVVNALQKLVMRSEVQRQQEELNLKATGSTNVQFVEPQSLAEIQAQEELDKIERLNNGSL